MNKMKMMKAALILFLLPLSLLARADNPSDQMIFRYTGNVIIPPCTVAMAKYDIDFGDINTETLAVTGSGTDWREVHLALTDCTNVNNVTLTLSNNVSAKNNNYFASTGTASHVAVEFSDPVGVYNTKPGGVIAMQIDGAPGIDFPFRVRIVNDGSGAATAGTIVSTITVNYEFK